MYRFDENHQDHGDTLLYLMAMITENTLVHVGQFYINKKIKVLGNIWQAVVSKRSHSIWPKHF